MQLVPLEQFRFIFDFLKQIFRFLALTLRYYFVPVSLFRATRV